MVPYIFGSVVYTILVALIGHKPESVKDLIALFLLGKSAQPFYYIIVLIYLTAMTPLLIRWSKDRRTISLTYGFASLLLLVCYILQWNGYDVFGMYIKYLPVWVIPYFTGILYRKYAHRVEREVNNTDRRPLRPLFLLVCSSAVILQIVETLILSSFSRTNPAAYSQMRFSGFIYVATILYSFLGCTVAQTSMISAGHVIKINSILLSLYLIGVLIITLGT